MPSSIAFLSMSTKRKKKYILSPLIFSTRMSSTLFPIQLYVWQQTFDKNVIATIEVLDSDLCELQCYHQPNCVSINFNVIPDSKGLHKCELNNATHRSHNSKLVNREHYVYKGAEVRNINLLLSFTENTNKQTLKSWFMSLSGRLTLSFGYEFMFGSDSCSFRLIFEFRVYLCSCPMSAGFRSILA